MSVVTCLGGGLRAEELFVDAWLLEWSLDYPALTEEASREISTSGVSSPVGEGASKATAFNRRGLARLCLSESAAVGERQPLLEGALGDFEHAAELFGLADAHTSQSAAMTNTGVVLTRLGRHEDARKAYDLALQMDSKNPWAMNNLGWWHFRHKKETEKARKLLEAASEKGCPMSPVNLAVLLLDEGKLGAAGEQLRPVVSGGASAIPRAALQAAHLNLGEIARRSGDWQTARREYEVAARLRPGDPHTLLRLAVMETALGAHQAGFERAEAAGRLFSASRDRGRACLVACIARLRSDPPGRSEGVGQAVQAVCQRLEIKPDRKSWEGFLLLVLADQVPEQEARAQTRPSGALPEEVARTCEVLLVLGERCLALGPDQTSAALGLLRESAGCKGVEYLLEHTLAKAGVDKPTR